MLWRNVSDGDTAMARVRSPNYPAISLREALSRLQLLFDKAQTQLISREQAAEAMGYDGLHGVSLGVISAVLKYGLLKKVDNQVKVTERGMSIIAPHNDEERRTAIHDAAFTPPLFGEIHERFLGEMPNDKQLRSFLIRKNYSSSALDRVLRSYRETIELVTDETGGYNDESQSAKLDTMHEPSQHSVQQNRERPTGPPRGTPFRVTFEGDAIEVTGRLTTPEEVDKLVKILQLNKVMITPVHGAIATKYTDDEEGREAEERDRKVNEEIDGDG